MVFFFAGHPALRTGATFSAGRSVEVLLGTPTDNFAFRAASGTVQIERLVQIEGAVPPSAILRGRASASGAGSPPTGGGPRTATASATFAAIPGDDSFCTTGRQTWDGVRRSVSAALAAPAQGAAVCEWHLIPGGILAGSGTATVGPLAISSAARRWRIGLTVRATDASFPGAVAIIIRDEAGAPVGQLTRDGQGVAETIVLRGGAGQYFFEVMATGASWTIEGSECS